MSARRTMPWAPPCWLVLALSAAAQSPTADQFLRTLDRNGDGLVSFVEWKGSSALFVRYDRDRDGYLGVTELSSDLGKPPPRAGAVEDAADRAARLPIVIGSLPDPEPAFFSRVCSACHNTARIEQASKDAFGWAETVARMQAKNGGAFSDLDARRITSYLEGLRDRLASEQARFGSDNPRRDWASIFDGAPLHVYDRDGNGRLSRAEVSRAVVSELDLDGDRELDLGEFSMIPVEGNRRDAFRAADRDKSGAVSLRELGAPRSLFELVDQDGDGMIAVDELPRLRSGPFRLLLVPDSATAIELLDRNKDGSLSGRELSHGEDLLAYADRDRDGSLSLDEVETAVSRGKGPGISFSFDDFVTRYDLNGDGRVEKSEFFGPSLVFRRGDRNGDGVISAKDASRSVAAPDFGAAARRWRR